MDNDNLNTHEEADYLVNKSEKEEFNLSNYCYQSGGYESIPQDDVRRFIRILIKFIDDGIDSQLYKEKMYNIIYKLAGDKLI